MFTKPATRTFISGEILEQKLIKLDVKLVKRALLRFDDKEAVIMQQSLSAEPDCQLGQLPLYFLSRLRLPWPAISLGILFLIRSALIALRINRVSLWESCRNSAAELWDYLARRATQTEENSMLKFQVFPPKGSMNFFQMNADSICSRKILTAQLF